jgi:hypothetical protein
MTNLKNTWNPGDGFFAAAAAAAATAQSTANGRQPADADLTAVAALTPADNDVLQRKSGGWTNRSPAQLKTDLALTKSDVGLASVDNTPDASKPVSTAQAAADTAAGAAALSSANSHSDAADITTLATATGRAIAFSIALG